MKKDKKIGLFFGFSNVLNLAGNNHNAAYLKIIRQSDREAIASDWQAIGNDFRKSLKEFDL